MTAPRTLPVVILRSLPENCGVCGGGEQVQCRPIDGTSPAVIPCPLCTAIDGLRTLIEVSW